MRNSKKTAAVISYFTIALNLVYNLLFTPFVIRALGQSEYGIYTLCTSIISYLALFQFGFGVTYIRYFIKFTTEGNKKKAEELNGMFTEIFVVIAILVIVAGGALIVNIKSVLGDSITQQECIIAATLLKYLLFNTVLSIIGVPFQALITANEKFVFQKILVLVEIGLRVVALFPLLLLGYKSIAIVAVSTIAAVVVFVANVAYCFRVLKARFRFTNFDFSLFKEMGIFSFFIFLQGIMDIFNWQIDRFLLARFHGTREISEYSVGAQINTVFIQLTTMLTSLFVPRVNQLIAAGKGDGVLTDLLIKVGRLQFLISGFILTAFIFFGQSFMKFFAGNGYKHAYPVALLLMVPMLLPLSMDLCYHIARAKAKHKTSTIVFAVAAFLNLLISIPLCKKYGVIGSAAGTCIGMFVANNVFQIYYSHKVIGLNMKRWAKSLLDMSPSLIIPVVVGTLIMLFVDTESIPMFLMMAFLYTLVSGISFWFFALNREEKELFEKPILSILHKDK